MTEPTQPSVARIPLSSAFGLTLLAGAVGWVTDRVAVHAGAQFPSFGYLAGGLVWKLATIGILAWAVEHYEGRRLDWATAGFTGGRASPGRYPVGALGVVVVVTVAASLAVGTSPGDASVYGEVHTAGIGLLLCEVLIRYPVTVVAEEALFRGWLQPRLGTRGPVWSAVLWGFYHLQQVPTIPSIVLFGLALGALRWWQGHVRLTATLHYFSNVVFFLTTYA